MTRHLLAAATSAVLALAAAAPADAYNERTTGRPGPVSLTQVQGSHIDLCQGQTVTIGGLRMPMPCWTPFVTASGPTVHRSPRTRGTQSVLSFYRLLRWDGGSWVVQSTSAQHTTTIAAGRRAVRLPEIQFRPNQAGELRVQVAIGWSSATGRTLGTRVLQYDQPGDYACATRFPCDARSGWVALRSPGV